MSSGGFAACVVGLENFVPEGSSEVCEAAKPSKNDDLARNIGGIWLEHLAGARWEIGGENDRQGCGSSGSWLEPRGRKSVSLTTVQIEQFMISNRWLSVWSRGFEKVFVWISLQKKQFKLEYLCLCLKPRV